MKRCLKNIFIVYSVFNVLINVWCFFFVNGIKGNCIDFMFNFFNCKVVLIGVGFGVVKRDFIIGIIC